MNVSRHLGHLVVLVLLAIVMAACGTDATNNKATTTTTTNQGMSTPAATNNMDGGGNMMQAITITPDMNGTNAFIRTGTVNMDGNQVNVLLTSTGYAVYTYKPDPALQATCTGDCAKDWPPVLAPKGMMTVSSSMTLTKPLSVQQTPNGAQVFYDGHALYTYAADKKAGLATGQGQDMQWFLANIVLTTAIAATTATPATTGGAMMQGIMVTPNTTGNMAAFIHTGVALINGNKVNVLLTNTNFTLYYYKADPMLQATCTGDCAKDWPPLLAPNGMMTISSSVALPKMFSVHKTANGAQVFYDGHALYTYAADTKAGIATGRGQDMLWYMVGFLL